MGVIIRNGINYSNESFVEVTQAQYDALSEADKMNGTVYLISGIKSIVRKEKIYSSSSAEQISYGNGTVKDALDASEVTLKSGVVLTRKGNLRILDVSNAYVDSLGVQVTLPEGDRPSHTIQTVGYMNEASGTVKYYVIYVQVRATGIVEVHWFDPTTTTVANCGADYRLSYQVVWTV